MGARGPVPNRSEDLARDRSRGGSDKGLVVRGTLRPVTIPKPDEDWHPIARMLWDSLLTSGQSDWYQDSDWAFAYSLCDDLSHYKRPSIDRHGVEYYKRSGQMLQTIYAAMGSLLVTEGDRLRVRRELVAPDDGEDNEADDVMSGYEDGLGLAQVIQFPTPNTG